MSGIAERELTNANEISASPDPLCVNPWNTLCAWLTRDLHDMEVTIERRSTGGAWVVEGVSFPLESVTTRETANGVRVISIGVHMAGKTKLFEVGGANSLGFRRNGAGWPVRVELGFEGGELVMLFSGQMDPQRQSSSNSWGE